MNRTTGSTSDEGRRCAIGENEAYTVRTRFGDEHLRDDSYRTEVWRNRDWPDTCDKVTLEATGEAAAVSSGSGCAVGVVSLARLDSEPSSWNIRSRARMVVDYAHQTGVSDEPKQDDRSCERFRAASSKRLCEHSQRWFLFDAERKLN